MKNTARHVKSKSSAAANMGKSIYHYSIWLNSFYVFLTVIRTSKGMSKIAVYFI